MQTICELLAGRPMFLGTDPVLPRRLSCISSARGKMEEGIDPALSLPLLGCISEVGVLVCWILVSEFQYTANGRLVPMPSGTRKQPVSPRLPAPLVPMPLITGRMRLMLVKGLRQRQWPHIGDKPPLGIRLPGSFTDCFRSIPGSYRRALGSGISSWHRNRISNTWRINPGLQTKTSSVSWWNLAPLPFRAAGGNDLSWPERVSRQAPRLTLRVKPLFLNSTVI